MSVLGVGVFSIPSLRGRRGPCPLFALGALSSEPLRMCRGHNQVGFVDQPIPGQPRPANREDLGPRRTLA